MLFVCLYSVRLDTMIKRCINLHLSKETVAMKKSCFVGYHSMPLIVLLLVVSVVRFISDLWYVSPNDLRMHHNRLDHFRLNILIAFFVLDRFFDLCCDAKIRPPVFAQPTSSSFSFLEITKNVISKWYYSQCQWWYNLM